MNTVNIDEYRDSKYSYDVLKGIFAMDVEAFVIVTNDCFSEDEVSCVLVKSDKVTDDDLVSLFYQYAPSSVLESDYCPICGMLVDLSDVKDIFRYRKVVM